jgi:hypothetical protein
MAGKKKGGNDVQLSKTARASKGKVKDQSFQASGELPRVVSLCQGEYAYVRDPRDGKNHHLKVGSDAWFAALEGVTAHPQGQRVKDEAVKLGFPVELPE